MEKLVDDKKASLIGETIPTNEEQNTKMDFVIDGYFAGVSNFSILKLKRLLKTCRIFPVVNQVELHPYFPQKALLDFCQSNGIHVTAFGPLGCKPMPSMLGRIGPGPLEDGVVSF